MSDLIIPDKNLIAAANRRAPAVVAKAVQVTKKPLARKIKILA